MNRALKLLRAIAIWQRTIAANRLNSRRFLFWQQIVNGLNQALEGHE